MLFGWFELLGLLFFEGFVYDAISVHQGWLINIYSYQPLRGSVHIGLSAFYLIGAFLSIVEMIHRWAGNKLNIETKMFFLLIISSLFWFFITYSFAIAHVRYTIAIAPVYIFLAFWGWETKVLRNSAR